MRVTPYRPDAILIFVYQALLAAAAAFAEAAAPAAAAAVDNADVVA